MKNSRFKMWAFNKWLDNVEEHQTYGELRVELNSYIQKNRWYLRRLWRQSLADAVVERQRQEKFSQWR